MSHSTLAIMLFGLVVFSWIMYACQELFISGASLLNISIAKDDSETKQFQVSSGLHFEGMEVWFIAAESLTFAAFPLVYATIFSQLYVVFYILVYALMMRAVSVEMMYKIDSLRWQKRMRLAWTVSSGMILFLFGVYITNLFYGFKVDGDGNFASFWSVLNVTNISGGMFFVTLGLVTGAGWIHFTTIGEVGQKAVHFVRKVGVIYMAPIFLLLTFMGLNNSSTSIFIGELFSKSWLVFILPLGAVGFAIAAMLHGYKRKGERLFIFGLLSMLFYLLTGFVGTFPYMVHSNFTKDYGISIEDAMSGPKSLIVILVVLSIFYPIIIGYQSWKYRTFARNIKPNDE